jgi:chemotaxis protein MotA
MIVEGVRLLLKKTNPIVVAEELNSFLQPHDRVDWKKVVKGAA